MRVFISWSGERSLAVAKALRQWLEDVMPEAKPWMSADDIDKGARWSTEIAQQLDGAGFGIICLTQENLSSAWVLFEAGAMSKSLPTRVCPYLFKLRPSEVSGPLSLFQMTSADNEADTWKLLQALNRALGEAGRPDEKLRRAFDKWWPDLKAALLAIPDSPAKPQQARPDRELLEEILVLIRTQARSQPLPVLDPLQEMPAQDLHRRHSRIAHALARLRREIPLTPVESQEHAKQIRAIYEAELTEVEARMRLAKLEEKIRAEHLELQQSMLEIKPG